MSTHRLFALGLSALAVVGGACGGASKDATAHASTVAIDTFMFQPRTLHVRAGDTVTWTNHDNITHTVTSGTRTYDPSDSGRVTATNKSGQFDMTLDTRGSTARVTFNKAGTVHYFCDRHPGMEADVEVR